MEKATKMLLMNLTFSSLILSILYAGILTNIESGLVSHAPYSSGPGDAVVFMLFFLILYMCHLVLSVLHYLVIRNKAWKLSAKMIAFNGSIAALSLVLYLSLDEPVVLFLLITPVVFSIRAVF